jgi:NAD(P)-dependent dehydrogenase (short-subunit alcohol dehydrogenase family)
MAARKFSFKSTAEDVLKGVDVKGKTAIVTGGSNGIGLETCRVLAKSGSNVIMMARNSEAANEAIAGIKAESPEARISFIQCDLSDLLSVKKACDEYLKDNKNSTLDMLICNAGVMAIQKLQRTKQGIEEQLGVNWLAHHFLVKLLQSKMTQQETPSRIVLVASLAHMMGGLDIEDLNFKSRRYSAWSAYGQSKTCNILHGRWLAHMLEGTNVKVFSLHPGNIWTGLQKHQDGFGLRLFFGLASFLPKPLASKTIPQGAATQVYAATAPELANVPSGEYLDDCKPKKTTKQAADMELAERLWNEGDKMLSDALSAYSGVYLAPVQ